MKFPARKGMSVNVNVGGFIHVAMLFVPKVVPQKTLVPKAILSMQVVPDCVNSNAVLAVSATSQ